MPRCTCITRKGTQCFNAGKDGQEFCGIHLNHGCTKKHTLELNFKVSLRNVDDGKILNFFVAPPKFIKETLNLIKTDTTDYYLPNAIEWANNNDDDENDLLATVKKVKFIKESPQLSHLLVQIESNQLLNDEVKRDLANSIANYDDDGNYGLTIDGELFLVHLRLMK